MSSALIGRSCDLASTDYFKPVRLRTEDLVDDARSFPTDSNSRIKAFKGRDTNKYGWSLVEKFKHQESLCRSI